MSKSLSAVGGRTSNGPGKYSLMTESRTRSTSVQPNVVQDDEGEREGRGRRKFHLRPADVINAITCKLNSLNIFLAGDLLDAIDTAKTSLYPKSRYKYGVLDSKVRSMTLLRMTGLVSGEHRSASLTWVRQPLFILYLALSNLPSSGESSSPSRDASSTLNSTSSPAYALSPVRPFTSPFFQSLQRALRVINKAPYEVLDALDL